MTNTQAEMIGQALALIHGELVAIRKSCERAETREFQRTAVSAPSVEMRVAGEQFTDMTTPAAPGAQRKRDARRGK